MKFPLGRANRLRWLTPLAGLALLTALLCPVAASAQDTAPPAPNKAWRPPRLDACEAELAQSNPRTKPDNASLAIDPNHTTLRIGEVVSSS